MIEKNFWVSGTNNDSTGRSIGEIMSAMNKGEMIQMCPISGITISADSAERVEVIRALLSNIHTLVPHSN